MYLILLIKVSDIYLYLQQLNEVLENGYSVSPLSFGAFDRFWVMTTSNYIVIPSHFNFM